MNILGFSFDVNDSDFIKSSYSHPGGTIHVCVSVAKKKEGVAVRDTKDASKNTLFFTNEEWDAFTKGVKNGEFD